MTPTVGALRGSPGFRRYLAARVVSAAGTLLTAVVLPVLLYRLTGSAGWTAAAVAVEAAPHLLLAPFAGAIAARLDRTRLLFTADLAGGALLASIPVAWWADALSGWQVLAVACAVQAVFVLLTAGHTRALPTLVGTGAAASAATAIRGATWLVDLMAPPLAGLAVAITPPAPLLTLDAVSFLASALLVRAALRSSALKAPSPRRRPATRARYGVRSGLRLLRTNPPARRLALARMLHTAAAAAYLAMLLPWADRQLDVPPSGDARLALLISSWGLGAMVAYSLAPALTRRFGAVRLAREGVLASWACAVGVLLCANWLPAVLAGLLWGAAHTLTSRAGLDALGQPLRAAARWLWRGVGSAVGATMAGLAAVVFEPRAGLALAVALLALAVLTIGRGSAPAPAGAVPAQPGPGSSQPTPAPEHTRPAQRRMARETGERRAEPDPTAP